jgi:hypothetical protein
MKSLLIFALMCVAPFAFADYSCSLKENLNGKWVEDGTMTFLTQGDFVRAEPIDSAGVYKLLVKEGGNSLLTAQLIQRQSGYAAVTQIVTLGQTISMAVPDFQISCNAK